MPSHLSIASLDPLHPPITTISVRQVGFGEFVAIRDYGITHDSETAGSPFEALVKLMMRAECREGFEVHLTL